MKRTLLSLALTMALLLSACSAGVTALQPAGRPRRLGRRDAALDTALGDFGLELLRQTRTAGENTFVSPLSAALCLSMAANGAAGGTLAQFEAVLAGDGSLETLNGPTAPRCSRSTPRWKGRPRFPLPTASGWTRGRRWRTLF